MVFDEIRRMERNQKDLFLMGIWNSVVIGDIIVNWVIRVNLVQRGIERKEKKRKKKRDGKKKSSKKKER